MPPVYTTESRRCSTACPWRISAMHRRGTPYANEPRFVTEPPSKALIVPMGYPAPGINSAPRSTPHRRQTLPHVHCTQEKSTPNSYSPLAIYTFLHITQHKNTWLPVPHAQCHIALAPREFYHYNMLNHTLTHHKNSQSHYTQKVHKSTEITEFTEFTEFTKFTGTTCRRHRSS